MKNHSLPILIMAAAAAFASGAASALSFSYQGLNYSDPSCTTSFSMDTNGGITCVTTTTTSPPNTAPLCNITQNPTFAQNGQATTISSNCSVSPNNPTSYSWTLTQLTPTAGSASTVSGATNYSPAISLAVGTYTVSLAAPNSIGPATGTLSTTLTVTTPPPPPPSTGNDAMCTQAGLTNTEMPLNWTMGFPQNINIGLNQSVSFPLMITTASSGGHITMSYTTGGTEIISISKDKCDFSQSLLATQCMVGGNAPNLTFQPTGSLYSNCALTPGVQYYVNVRNAVMSGRLPKFPIVDSCTSGRCVGNMTYMY